MIFLGQDTGHLTDTHFFIHQERFSRAVRGENLDKEFFHIGLFNLFNCQFDLFSFDLGFLLLFTYFWKVYRICLGYRYQKYFNFKLLSFFCSTRKFQKIKGQLICKFSDILKYLAKLEFCLPISIKCLHK